MEDNFEQVLNNILKNASCTHLMFFTESRPEGLVKLKFKVKQTGKNFTDPYILDILWRRIREIHRKMKFSIFLYFPLYEINPQYIHYQIIYRYFEMYLKDKNNWNFEESKTFEYDNKILTVLKNNGKIFCLFNNSFRVNYSFRHFNYYGNVICNFIDSENEYETEGNVVNFYRSDIFKVQNHHYRINRLLPFKKTIKEQLARWQQELWKPPNGHFAKKYACENMKM